MMTRTELRGFVPAIVTPFSDGGEIMEDAFLELFEYLISLGATAVCIAGDNGESWSLSPAERGRLTRIAVDRAAGRVKIITGCSAPTLNASMAYAREAEQNGADALLSMPQTYVLKATRDEIVRRFDALAKGVSLPIVAYNSPRRVGFSMSIGDIEAIMNVAPIIGIKESERDFFHHTHLIESFRDRMAIMVGPCHYIFPGIALGAHGFIATGPEFLGVDTARLTLLARDKPTAEIAALHYKLTVLYELLMGTATWPASFKAALNLIGLPAGVPRDPVAPAAAADIDKIRRTFDKLGIARVQ
jgi:4-hydroxy-tetrahydrodipicolinate synthase